MASIILKIMIKIVATMFRRGVGLFKFLFVIDDTLRIFTMTLLFPILFSWLGFGRIPVIAGTILGLIIDVHDLMEDYGIGKTETIDKPF
ncbi:MAG: hypothetical protein V1859_09140 [archaeon]